MFIGPLPLERPEIGGNVCMCSKVSGGARVSLAWMEAGEMESFVPFSLREMSLRGESKAAFALRF